MRRMPDPRKFFLPIVALAAAGFVTGVALAAPAASQSGAPDQTYFEEPFVPVTGVGETILIVVGGAFASLPEAEAAEAVAQQAFGHLQGFYIDDSANYDVIGVYEQTSADQRVVPCADWKQETKMECPPGFSEVKAYQEVRLRHVAREDARPFLAANDQARCGTPALRPCVRANLNRLLSNTVALKPGRFLLLSAFRTKQGAAEGVEFARIGVDQVSVLRVLKTGGGYVGLGQEANPDGSGPLSGPLPDPAKYQE